jgi:hypothetical protein
MAFGGIPQLEISEEWAPYGNKMVCTESFTSWRSVPFYNTLLISVS